MLASIIAIALCALLLYAAGVHVSRVWKDQDVDKSMLFAFICLVLAFVFAKFGGI